MFLAFSIADIIQVPFGYLLDWLYQFSGSYGFALIVFSIVVQLVLLPMTAKSKKSMMKMSRPRCRRSSAATPMIPSVRMPPSRPFIKKRAFPWAAAACGACCPCW